MEKITVAVTGHDGFIGSRLLAQLHEDSRWGVIPFVGDLAKAEDVEAFFDRHPNIQHVIHLAGLFFGDASALFSVNGLGTLHLVEIGAAHGVQRIIAASTGAVYGEPQGGISKESDPREPNTLYGLSKLYAEESLEYAARTKGVQTVLLRFPNVYGPGNAKGVIYQFLSGIAREGKITIAGSGEQKRNFLHVDDAVTAIVRAMSYEGPITSFNIAGKELVSLNELAQILQAKGLNFEVVHAPADQKNALQILSLDIARAKEHLGWTPRRSLADGIQQLMEQS